MQDGKGRCLESFNENKKLFWKTVNEVRKPRKKVEGRTNDG